MNDTVNGITEMINAVKNLTGVGVCYYDLNAFFQYDKYGIRIEPSELCYGNVVCDREELSGDHHRCKKSGKERVFALELESRESESRKNCDNEREDRRNETDDYGVEEESAEVCRGKRLKVVAPKDLAREKRRDRKTVLDRTLEGRNDHPIEGENDDQRHRAKEGVKKEHHNDLGDLLSDCYLLHVFFMHCG